jgi:hypothetical protein
LDALDRGQRLWDKRKQILERVAVDATDDNAQASLRDVLLKLEALVAGSL